MFTIRNRRDLLPPLVGPYSIPRPQFESYFVASDIILRHSGVNILDQTSY